MKFSIGIPAYKATFLEECIKSCLSQSYPDFELIIVNDASPENLDEIIKSFNDSRIRYFKNKENCGAINIVDNWNKCLYYAQGEYFVLMGDDDKLESNFLEEFLNLIEKYPHLDIYHCRSYIIDEHSKRKDITSSWPEFESLYENMFHRLRSLRQQYISDFVYKTNSLKLRNGFYKLPLAWASDDISAYMAIGEKGIAHTNQPLFNYRRNSLSISTGNNATIKLKALIKEKQWLKNHLREITVKGDLDLMIFEMLSSEIDIYSRKKRIRTIKNSYSFNLLGNFIHFIFHSKVYESSTAEVVLAMFEYWKSTLSKKIN